MVKLAARLAPCLFAVCVAALAAPSASAGAAAVAPVGRAIAGPLAGYLLSNGNTDNESAFTIQYVQGFTVI